MSVGVQVWSQTASANSTSDTNINWEEGMAPSQVNDSARAQMASVAKWRDDNSGTLVTSGSTTAFTVTSNQVSTGNTNGYTIAVRFHATADTSATLNVDSGGAAPIQLVSGTNLLGSEISAGDTVKLTYSSTALAWLANCMGYIGTNEISASAVTYSRIQNESANTILGNPTGSSAAPSEISLGTGLSFSGTSLTAPAVPVPAAFKNLVIKVTGTSSATATADFVTMATSGSSSFQTIALNGTVTISSGASGAIGGIDVQGAPSGQNTFYALWACSTAASTQAQLLASTSFTTPLLPGNYTYKARVGALVTSTSSSTSAVQLMGTYQFGRQARYVTGVGATGALPVVISGTAGSSGASTSTSTAIWASASTTNFVPSTATQIGISLCGAYKNGGSGTMAVAPNQFYGGLSSAAPPPLGTNAGTLRMFNLLGNIDLETVNIYFVSDSAGSAVLCQGWEDNI